jgi:hypothetical protein
MLCGYILSSRLEIHNSTINTKKRKMKKLLVAAFSMLILNATYAQDNSDEDMILNERIGLDGSPMPAGHDHEDVIDHPLWSHLTTLTISPFQYTESGVGVGLSYERALDHEGYLSVYVPVIAAFKLRTNNSYDSYYYGNNYNPTNYMFYVNPGVKFYPTGMGRCKYAVGPNAVIGYGQRNLYNNYYYNTYDPYSQTSYVPYGGTYDRWILGMMINNSLNINATPHLYVGAEMGFGFTYFDRIGGINYGVKFLTQGAFKIGYTF